MLIAFLSVGYFSVCFAEDHFTITNKSGFSVYIYDWDTSASPAKKTLPVQGADPLANGNSIKLSMQTVSNSGRGGRRIYVSANELSQSLQGGPPSNKPATPDAFTPWYDGGVMYSFLEYLYEPGNDRYTVDLSYIDEFSYPITIKFSGDSSFSGYEENFEYGFKSLSEVKTALTKQSSTYPWGNLVWPKDNPSNPGKAKWPKGIYRVIGPNKVWTSDSFGLSAYAPNPYHGFVKILPYNGKQLFKIKTNFDGWRFSTSEPELTGYVKALHSAAEPDINGKYGFFCYPEDNANGEFTWVPLKAQSTLTIYPYDQ